LLDVDHFKQFNDLYGHPAGDECLRLVAEAIELAIRRPGDVAARYGGEEFAVILLDTAAEGAARVAETVRAAIEALAIPHGGCPSMRVTASIGVSTVTPTPEITPRLLIGLADQALYQAKRQGRNRICCIAIPATTPESAPTAKPSPDLDAGIDRAFSAG
jgi:diguanylate cyclase (GGDEF)-like protein